MTLGMRIAALRKENGLSQEAFAEQIGVSRQAVSKWESDASVPEVDKFAQISTLFGVSIDYLIKGTPDEPAPPVEPETPPVTPPANADAFHIDVHAEDVPPAPHTPEPASDAAPAVFAKPAKHGKKKMKKWIALLLVVCLLAAGTVLQIRYDVIREAWWALCGGKVQYPYVLVHGLGGWGSGDGINKTAQYWGADTGDLVEYLNSEGYTVCAPSVGPVSSTWDRACELYAQLTGTTVDYGAAHAAQHNHARFGRSYSQPLVANWGGREHGFQRVKINLVGHSFGGATVRLLTSLLAFGSEAEQEATGKETSGLFTGGKGSWVNSVTTLCAPHNGSSLTCVLGTLGGIVGISDPTQLLASLCFALAGAATPLAGTYDFMLDQFGISQTAGTADSLRQAVAMLTAQGNDHAGYDLSPDGAKALNDTIHTVKGVYYFSYSYCTTRQGKLLGVQVPVGGTLPVLIPFATAMGMYRGTTPGGIEISADWQPNDGLVSVVSAQYPAGEPSAAVPEQPQNARAYQRGVWYVEETLPGDHGTVIGLHADAGATHAFWTAHLSLVDALRR